MAFYSPDGAMAQRLSSLVQRLGGERGEALANGLSITWLHYPASVVPPSAEGQAADDRRAVPGIGTASGARGASWQGERLRDPGDLVQLPYLIASELWLQQGLLEDEPELRRAQLAMIRRGSHDATSYVVDRLSGTTSGPALAAHRHEAWLAQRQLVNAWLASLDWPDLAGCRAVQKTWQDGPYGRERTGLGADFDTANRFSSDGLARLFEGVVAGSLISPPACQRMRGLLAVGPGSGGESVDAPAGLAPLLAPPGAGWRRFWGRGGRGPQIHQLALYGEREDQGAALLVVLAEPELVEGLHGLVAAIAADLLGADPFTG